MAVRGTRELPAIQQAILILFGAAVSAGLYFILATPIATPSSSEVQDHQKPSRNLASDTENANPMVRRGFSATRVMDVFRATRDGRDFLSIYLRNDLPDYISKADIELIQYSIRTFREEANPIASNFRRGMIYFFLALTETIWLVEGNSIDSVGVDAHWREAESNLSQSGTIGRDLAIEIHGILQSVDADSDGRLTPSELRQIILERE